MPGPSVFKSSLAIKAAAVAVVAVLAVYPAVAQQPDFVEVFTGQDATCCVFLPTVASGGLKYKLACDKDIVVPGNPKPVVTGTPGIFNVADAKVFPDPKNPTVLNRAHCTGKINPDNSEFVLPSKLTRLDGFASIPLAPGARQGKCAGQLANFAQNLGPQGTFSVQCSN